MREQYYENRYLIDALESTSSELITKMESMSEFSREMILTTAKILNRADFIKFAKGSSSAFESGQDLNQVIDLVNSTKIEALGAEEAQEENDSSFQ